MIGLILFVAIIVFSLSADEASAIAFAISNASVDQDQIEVKVDISEVTSANCPNLTCYLQGMLKHSSGTRYFGFTRNASDQWVDYISSPDADYIQSNFFKLQVIESSWSGKLKIKFNSDDIDYKGPGNYDLKVKRYTGNSNSGSDSNTLPVILDLPVPTPTPSPTPTNTPNTTPTATPLKTSTPTPTPLKTKTPTPMPSLSPSLSPSSSPEVLGAIVSPSPVSSPSGVSMSNSSLPVMPIILVGLGLTSIGIASFPFLKSFYLERVKGYNDTHGQDS